MYVIRTASVIRSGRPIVNRIDTVFEPGRLTVVAGPNGAGKSTLLKLLARELTPSRGDVELNGRPLSSYPVAELARRRAVLPQESHLAFPFTVLEVVRLAHAAIAPGEAREEDEQAIRALRSVGLGDHGSRSYQTLSGGEQQRVQLARVLTQLRASGLRDEPGFLLLDEPISNLDVKHQVDIFRLVRGLADQGTGVVAILHDLNIAAMFADRLIVMKDGAIAADGPPRAALTDDLLESVFGLPLRVCRTPADGTAFVLPQSAAIPPA